MIRLPGNRGQADESAEPDIGSPSGVVVQEPQGQDPQRPSMRDEIRQTIKERGDALAERSDLELQQRWNLAIRTRPEVAAEAQRIAKQLGKPPQLVEDNIDIARELQRGEALRMRDFQRTHPVLARQLEDIEFVKVAQDDLDNLAGTEGFFQRLAQSAERGNLTNELGYIGARMASNLAGDVDKRRLEWIRQRLTLLPQSEGVLQNTSEVLGQMSSTVPKALTAGLVVGGLGGPAAGAVATGTALFSQSAIIEGGNAYLEMIDLGLDEHAAARAAIGVGLVNGALEVIGQEATFGLARGVKQALSSQIKKAVVESLVQPTAKSLGGKFALRYAGGLTTEVATEVLQEVTNIVGEANARSATPGAPPALDNIGERLAEIAVKTTQGMLLLGGIGPGARFVADSRRAAAAERTAQTLERLSKQAGEVKMGQHSPDAFETFLGRAAKGGPAENVYIEGRAFAEVLNQAGVTYDDLQKMLPEVAARYDEATKTGDPDADIVIPIGLYIAKVARVPEIGEALKRHLRLDPEAKSLAEAEAFRQVENEQKAEAAKILEQNEKEGGDFAASARAVEDNLREQILAAAKQAGADKITHAEARDSAKLYTSMVVVQSQRAGLTPTEFVAKYPLRVLAGAASPQAEFRQFAGPMALTVDHEKGSAAQRRLEAGEDPEVVRRETGFHRGADGRLRFEIDDSDARLKPELRIDRMRWGDALHHFRGRRPGDGPVTLGEVLDHPRLFQAYPDLAKIQVTEGANTREGGSLLPALRRDDWSTARIQVGPLAGSDRALRVLLHELQHAIQEIEGFAVGADATRVAPEQYRRSAGEVEARNTEARQFLSDEGRQNVPPERTADVPSDQVIVEWRHRRVPAAEFHAGDRGGYRPRDFTVLLHKKADASTVMHELAHHYLHVLSDLAEQDATPQGAGVLRQLDDDEAAEDPKKKEGKSKEEKRREKQQKRVVRSQAAIKASKTRREKAEQMARAGKLDLLAWIALRGGMRRGKTWPGTTLPEHLAARGWEVLRVFSERATLNWEQMAMAAQEEGWFPGETESGGTWSAEQFVEAVHNALAGAQVLHPNAFEGGDQNYLEDMVAAREAIEKEQRESESDPDYWRTRAEGARRQDDERDAIYAEMRAAAIEAGRELPAEFFPDNATFEERRLVELTALLDRVQHGRGSSLLEAAAEQGLDDAETIRRLEEAAIAAGADLPEADDVDDAGLGREEGPDDVPAAEEGGGAGPPAAGEAVAGGTPSPFAADLQTLLDWFGVKDIATWKAMSIEQQRKHHEKFAYSFESWLFDGKAPSKALERLFHRFARWLRNLYGSIRGAINANYRSETGEDLPVLTDEVRGVFDRMLASEAEIARASDVRAMAETFESQEQSGMGDAEWQAHLALQDEATDEALAEHTRASLRDMQWLGNARGRVLKDLQKKAAATRDKVRAEVTEELERLPVNRARAWIDRGEVVDEEGKKGVQAGGVHKLNLDAVRALLPEGEEPKGLTGRYGIAHKNGLMPDVVAPVFGFDTGRELVDALLKAPKLEDAIEAETDARMLAEHSELADPKKRERLVAEALRNDARTRLIGTDLRAVAKAMQPVRVLVQAAREAAKRAIGRQEVWRIAPREHQVAEARAAREFGEALRGGDIAAAIDAQRRRLLQHELVKAAGGALEEIDGALQDIGRFDGRDEKIAKTRDIDLVNAGRRLAAAYGLHPRAEGSQQPAQWRAAVEKVKAEHPVIGQRLSTLLEDAGDGVRDYRDLTLERFRELHEVLESLWNEAGRAKVLEANGRRVEAEAAVGALTGAIDARPERKAPGAKASTEKSASGAERAVLRGWHVFASLKRMRFVAWFMDGGQSGPFTEYFVERLQRASDALRKKFEELVSRLHPKTVEVRKAAGALWDADIKSPSLGHVFRGKKEIIQAMLHAGSHSGLEKLLVPYGWAAPPETTGDVLVTTRWDAAVKKWFDDGVLTALDVDYLRFTWGLYAELLPLNQKTHKALYGFEVPTIEHRQIQTPFGAIEGGYVPAYTDKDIAQSRIPQTGTIEGEELAAAYSLSTGRGHMITRNPFYRQPLSLDLSQHLHHLNAHLRFIYLQPALKDALRIIRHRKFKDAIDAYDKEIVPEVLMPYLNNIALQSTSRPSPTAAARFIDTAANWLGRGTSIAMLGFSALNGFMQITGLAAAQTGVRGRFTRAALGSPVDSVRVALAKSTVVREQFDVSVEKMREDLERMMKTPSWPILPADLQRGVKATQQVLGRAAFFLQRYVQAFVNSITWNAAYQQSIAESKADGSVTMEQAEQEAVEFANGVVKRTQGSRNPEDVAGYESGPAMMKLLFQMQGYSNVVLNSIIGQQQGTSLLNSPRVRAMLWVLLVAPLMEGALRQLLAGAPDDDDGDGRADEIAMHYAKSVGRNAAGLVPLAGPMIAALAESEGDRLSATPAATALAGTVRGVFAMIDKARGGDTTAYEWRAIGTALTVVTGFPLVPIGRAMAYEADVEHGKARPSGPVDYARGLVVGR